MREIHLICRDARLVRPHQWAFSRAPNRNLAYIKDARAVRPYMPSEMSLVYLGNLNCPPKGDEQQSCGGGLLNSYLVNSSTKNSCKFVPISGSKKYE